MNNIINPNAWTEASSSGGAQPYRIMTTDKVTEETKADLPETRYLEGYQKAKEALKEKGFNKDSALKVADTAGLFIDTGSKMLQTDLQATQTETAQKVRGGYDAIANAAMAFAPYGTIAGLAMKVGALAYDGINLAGAKQSDSINEDYTTTERVGGSYLDWLNQRENLSNQADKKFGLFNSTARKKANRAISQLNAQADSMNVIADNSRDWEAMGSDMSDFNNLRAEYNAMGGYDQRYNLSAKQGAKLELKSSWTPILSEEWKPIISNPTSVEALKTGGSINKSWKPEITELKSGGKTKDKDLETGTTQKNVIPEGALHKNKHHLNDLGFDDKGLTKKGIPVVDNEGHQLAEIELNEIIFTLEVTKKLEEGYHKFYDQDTSTKEKEELAFKAGKLLWHEILYNTDDRTGLIDTLKEGGILKALEETLDLV